MQKTPYNSCAYIYTGTCCCAVLHCTVLYRHCIDTVLMVVYVVVYTYTFVYTDTCDLSEVIMYYCTHTRRDGRQHTRKNRNTQARFLPYLLLPQSSSTFIFRSLSIVYLTPTSFNSLPFIFLPTSPFPPYPTLTGWKLIMFP